MQHALLVLPLVGSALGSGAQAATTPAPVIRGQPGWQVLQVGQHAGFLMGAINATGYQWYVTPANGGAAQPIPGATQAFLFTPPVTASQNGQAYDVVASGPGGSVTSIGAQLVVGPNNDGSPPDTVLGNPSALPKAHNVLTVAFVNGSLGRVPDNQMF